MPSPEYFDYAATTPVDRRVAELMLRYMCEDYGNAGSRTHSYGTNARAAVEEARALVAELVSASEDEVIFTSGATEANNISTLGLASFGERVNRRHLVTTAIEHKAVLEPLEHLAKSGFDLTILPVDQSGSVDPDEVRLALRSDTLLVSVMHVNNETGVIQPIKEIGEALADHHSYFHVDAAQGFGKELELLRNPRVDLISISGHKIYAPQGVGALVTRKRNGIERAPLESLNYGGGQERGIRPGTVSVPLAVALGEAARLASEEHLHRSESVSEIEANLLKFVDAAGGTINGDRTRALPQIVNASFRGLNSEALILALKGHLAISNGAACSSHSYERSHVLEAMRLDEWRIGGAVRFSFSHTTSMPDWQELIGIIDSVRF